jgi:hypothetical protein
MSDRRCVEHGHGPDEDGQCFQCGDQLVPAASSIAKRYETRAADQVTVNRADLEELLDTLEITSGPLRAALSVIDEEGGDG